MNVDALLAGVFGIAVGYQAARYAFRRYVAVLKEQVRATRGYADASAESSRRWKEVADLASAEARTQRQERQVAERRLTLVRDNMHRERER